MIRTLLDTSAYSAHFRNHPGVSEFLGYADEVYLSVVVLGELRAGFLKGSRVRRNEESLQEFLSQPRVSVLPVDEDTSDCYATILNDLRRRGRHVSLNDVWIAATAFQHNLRLLTTDRDFQAIPQVLVDFIEP